MLSIVYLYVLIFNLMNKDCCKENFKKARDILRLKDFLKVISDTNRLRILCLVAQKELCVCEIFKALQLPQNLVSHHLAKLKKLSLLQERKDGTFIIYSINQEILDRYKTLFNQIVKG